MADRRRSVIRAVGYSLAVLCIAFFGPLLARMGSRSAGWARGTASDVASNWSGTLLRIFGLDGPESHRGEPGHLLDELLAAAISASNRRP